MGLIWIKRVFARSAGQPMRRANDADRRVLLRLDPRVSRGLEKRPKRATHLEIDQADSKSAHF
jgi:hypothetical protein